MIDYSCQKLSQIAPSPTNFKSFEGRSVFGTIHIRRLNAFLRGSWGSECG